MNKDVLKLQSKIEIPDNFMNVQLRKNATDYRFHYHEYFEIEFILSGKGKTIVNGNEIELKKGVVYMLRPTDMHEFFVDEKITNYNVSFTYAMMDNELMQEFMSYNNYVYCRLSESETEELLSLMRFLEKEYKGKNKSSDKVKRWIFNVIVSYVLKKRVVNSDLKLDANDNCIIEGLKYLHANFFKDPSLNETADITGLQKNYFCRKFKETTGKTYVEYLNDLKIDYAKQLLQSTEKSITELCFICGYHSMSQFITEFKKRTGFSPKLYRKNKSMPN